MFKLLRAKISIIWLKALISIAAVGVIVVRICFPDVKLDAIALGLIILAILPWFSELIESAKFPGGWEVKFRDLQEAAASVTAGTPPLAQTSGESERPSFVVVAEHDPNLALVALRIEIEKRLREYARRNDFGDRLPVSHLIGELAARQALPPQTVAGLRQLISAGNSAAHGARVQDDVADWALGAGPQILAAMDQQLQ
ncbi:MAG: hypothetical protein HY318_07870 [Armatimonadetes bacterium]|nr:hypothetical protein [Armatimonadota bacterium]